MSIDFINILELLIKKIEIVQNDDDYDDDNDDDDDDNDDDEDDKDHDHYHHDDVAHYWVLIGENIVC